MSADKLAGNIESDGFEHETMAKCSLTNSLQMDDDLGEDVLKGSIFLLLLVESSADVHSQSSQSFIFIRSRQLFGRQIRSS